MNRARWHGRSEAPGEVPLCVLQRPTKVVCRHGLYDGRGRVLLSRHGRIGEVPAAWMTIQPLDATAARLAAAGLDAGVAAVLAEHVGNRPLFRLGRFKYAFQDCVGVR